MIEFVNPSLDEKCNATIFKNKIEVKATISGKLACVSRFSPPGKGKEAADKQATVNLIG